MYHCKVQWYFVGRQRDVFDFIRLMPPLAHFTHSFYQSETPEQKAAEQADVILAQLEDADAEAVLQALCAHRKSDSELILMGSQEVIARLTSFLPECCDIWMGPLPEWEVRFRFKRWQHNYQRSKELWETSQFLETTINSSPDLVWYKDKNGKHVKVNDSFCKVVGKSKQDIEGRNHAYIWNVEQDDPVCVESEQDVIERRETCISDEVVLTEDGAMQLTTYKSPLYNCDGSVMGTVGIAINVTQERAYEREITDKNRTLEMLFSTMDCGMVCHSLDGRRIISVNQAALRLLDYESQDELLKDGFHLVAQSVLDEDKPKFRECITSLKKVGDSVSTEYRVRHKDGKVLHLLGNVKLVEEDGELYYQRFLLDYTAQRIQEEEKWAQKDKELQYQEQMFDIFSTFLADNVDDVYMMMDGDGTKVEFVTPNVERVLGIPWKTILDDLNVIGRAKYSDGKEVEPEHLTALKPGMALEMKETERIHKKTGEHKWFQESVYCVSLQGVKKIIVYISDRTKERTTQHALSEALEICSGGQPRKFPLPSSTCLD